jgi:hypothetical protein
MTMQATPIDLAFRPKTYFWPLGLETQLLTHVKGAARRAALQRLIDEDRFDEIPNLLAKAKLSEAERTAIGRMHPRYMGGEYLPDQEAGEVEIARIEIASTTGDVTSVYARRDGNQIHYRVVDEYEGDTLEGETERNSSEPLTLGELTEFFLGAWNLLEVLELNEFADLDAALAFFRGRSEFYPDFDRLLRERVTAAWPEPEAEKDLEDEDADET